MILNDVEIAKRCIDPTIRPMIDPFTNTQVKVDEEGKLISYGLSSFGYDIRVATEFKIFTNVHCPVVDPKNFDPRNFIDITSRKPVQIPANSFALCRSLEKLTIPRDLVVVAIGKSTYARCGIVCNVTPLEPEWEGHITIEISNTTPNPALIYPNEGICQLLFFRHPDGCRTSYADKGGKYQGQEGVTLAKV